MAISEWVSMDSSAVHTRKTRKTMCLHGELVDGFFGLGGVEFGQHNLHGRIVLELFTSGFAEGILISVEANMLLYDLCVGSHAQKSLGSLRPHAGTYLSRGRCHRRFRHAVTAISGGVLLQD